MTLYRHALARHFARRTAASSSEIETRNDLCRHRANRFPFAGAFFGATANLGVGAMTGETGKLAGSAARTLCAVRKDK
jgi:hypothetical protein